MDSNCRIHRQTIKPDYMGKTHNLVEFLKAYIVGGHVTEAVQVDSNRIIQITINRSGTIYYLIIRLWGGFPNIIITSKDYTILHLHRKSSKKSELPGMKFTFPDIRTTGKSYILTKHNYPDYNSFIEAEYINLIKKEKEEKQLKNAELYRKKREKEIGKQLKKLTFRLADYKKGENYKLYGDLILSNIHKMKKGDYILKTVDYSTGEQIEIILNPELKPDQNSSFYYKKHQKALSGMAITEKLINTLKEEREHLKTDLPDLPKQLIKKTVKPTLKPGLNYNSNGWEIIVGRSATENETILRKWVKGNDMWLHVRDYPGSYVFIKSQRGKTIPLNILMDAGILALYYSKGKSNGKGDITYTHVKYLRRVKKGKPGQVIPTMNKNLYVAIDPQRLNALKP